MNEGYEIPYCQVCLSFPAPLRDDVRTADVVSEDRTPQCTLSPSRGILFFAVRTSSVRGDGSRKMDYFVQFLVVLLPLRAARLCCDEHRLSASIHNVHDTIPKSGKAVIAGRGLADWQRYEVRYSTWEGVSFIRKMSMSYFVLTNIL